MFDIFLFINIKDFCIFKFYLSLKNMFLPIPRQKHKNIQVINKFKQEITFINLIIYTRFYAKKSKEDATDPPYINDV